jgi:hypothetical protein
MNRMGPSMRPLISLATAREAAAPPSRKFRLFI